METFHLANKILNQILRVIRIIQKVETTIFNGAMRWIANPGQA